MIITKASNLRNCDRSVSILFRGENLIVTSQREHLLIKPIDISNRSNILAPGGWESFSIYHNAKLMDTIDLMADISRIGEEHEFEISFLEEDKNTRNSSQEKEKSSVIIDHSDNVFVDSISSYLKLPWMDKISQIATELGILFFLFLLVILSCNCAKIIKHMKNYREKKRHFKREEDLLKLQII